MPETMPDPVAPAFEREPEFAVKLAETQAELEAAQRLRYSVFVSELGSAGPMVDHNRALERDRFDPYVDHLILTTQTRPGAVIGVYRLLREEQAARAGQFYSEDEYDLSVLKASGRRLLELGRSCIHPDFRRGLAMYHLWTALDRYIAEHRIEILFGVASFHGTDTDRLAGPLSLLWQDHLAPPELRVTAREPSQRMDMIDAAALDRRAAMIEMPSLIKAYLKLGGHVGAGAFVDWQFNTTDVCLVMDASRMRESQKAIYKREFTK